MKVVFTSLALVVLFSSVLSLPSERRDDGSTLTETQALNFALSLEHFQYYFYQQLHQYEPQDFSNAGLPPWSQGRYAQISSHELTHTQFLENILGDKADQPCTYTFPDTDLRSFVKTSNIVEAIASSMYISLVKYLSDSVHRFLSLHVGNSTQMRFRTISFPSALFTPWKRDTQRGSTRTCVWVPAWSTAFDAPLSLSQLYTVMSAFITSCPSSNSHPPVTKFPALTFTDSPQPGQTVQVSFTPAASKRDSQTLYAWFISGFRALVVPLNADMTVTIPDALQGFVFSVITNNRERVSDDATVAGPAFLVFDYDYQGNGQSLPM
ncbi:ferritin-like domain-containing protein [Suillus paluster]|uniref:ferritin-like domain-containing protein n=1 Tax=Suillus paluster TaxID=48578 RepID=UPI001B86DB89|nr:ferritin-like domain-containing protein [Suillus paluster]KAG1733374.1 ferritin-like domain-containing protein [Suillus paluster]